MCIRDSHRRRLRPHPDTPAKGAVREKNGSLVVLTAGNNESLPLPCAASRAKDACRHQSSITHPEGPQSNLCSSLRSSEHRYKTFSKECSTKFLDSTLALRAN